MNGLASPPRDAAMRRRMLVVAIVLIGMAASVAVETRRQIGKPAETIAPLPGFTADAVPAPGSGLVVTSLRTGSEAQRDGIAVGDEVLAIDNHPVQSLIEAEQITKGSQADRIALRVLHNSRPRELILHTSGVRSHEP